MSALDAQQERVVRLPFGEHRAIIGAPGSGKTRTLVALYTNLVTERQASDSEVLVLGANRLVAQRLREQLDRSVPAPAGSPRARSSTSLAHAVLSAYRRSLGEPPLRLLTGAAQDELIDVVIRNHLNRLNAESQAVGMQPAGGFVSNTPTFRNQFRELVRMVTDYELVPQQLVEWGDTHGVSEWGALAPLLTSYDQLRQERFPLHRDAATLHAEAVRLLATVPIGFEAAAQIGDFASLRALLVDDAQELTESSLNLLAAFAQRGVTVWAFGDPDISTGAFQGAAHRALSDLGSALGSTSTPPLVLPNVYRHGEQIRAQVRLITEHIGTSGLGEQRRASVTVAPAQQTLSRVQFAKFSSAGEAAEAIAYRLRQRHLGLADGQAATEAIDGAARVDEPVNWSDMAVVCRTRGEVMRISEQLAAANVPTHVRAGGRTLSAESVVRDLLLLTQLSFGWRELDAETVTQLLIGPIGGLDTLGLKRLQTAMQLADGRRGTHRAVDELLVLAAADEHAEEHIDTRQGGALRRFARVLRAGQTAVTSGGDLSEVLWALWDATGLSTRWERAALGDHAVMAAEANASLDAVMALFFSCARFEEQEIQHDREGFVSSVLESALPEDSLAASSKRDAVTVTTPQGMIGRSASLVVVTQLIDGVWPNLKSRGTLLHLEQLANVANGQPNLPLSSRRDVLHDELRLFAQAVSRAERELLCVALHNDDAVPSVFFSAGEAETPVSLPSSRLTLRGMVAKLRRQLNENPDDDDAARYLALLAREGVPGAHPDQWYGIEPLSTHEPLHDLSNPDSTVPVSPSRLEAFETCPLNWAISQLGGDHTVSAAALGTLIHQAMETASSSSFEALMTRVDSGWSVLSFDADWQQERSHRIAEEMVASLSTYLTEFDEQHGQLVGAEQQFELTIGQAHIRGTVDRVELRPGVHGEPARVLIVDLKTQRQAPSAAQIREHPQLSVYQLAAHEGKLPTEGAPLAGAALLLVHPKAVGANAYKMPVQEPLGDDARAALVSRLREAAEGMSRATFTAELEHHCTSPYAFGNCSLHVIRAVSSG